MRKEQFETAKEIQPLDEWKCFTCLLDKRNLEVFAEDEKRIYLICEDCRRMNERNLLESKTLRNL